MERIGVVFLKEFFDNLRDRRSIIGTLIGAMLGPSIILLLIIILGQAFFREVTEEPLELPVAGAENAPSLIQFLEQQNVVILPAPADPEAAVRGGEVEVVLVIPAEYGEDFAEGQPSGEDRGRRVNRPMDRRTDIGAADRVSVVHQELLLGS